MINVEFKAELRDPEIARAVCRSLGAVRVGRIEQTDTYFRVPDGRLKKRETAGEPVEWIFYDREDRATPKLSRFTIYDEAHALARFGARPLPIWVVVSKSRELWVKDGVRIHLDRVDGLGEYLEFEALVTPKHNVERAHGAIKSLREAFAPALGEAISCGYSDLLMAEKAPHLG